MLPKWHAFWGLVFVILFKLLVPEADYLSLLIIFFGSVFIDFDHYLAAGIKTKNWSVKHAIKHNYEGRKQIIELKKIKGICKKGDFHIFHTVESHLFVGLLGVFFAPFFFLLIGMVLHSTLDIIWMVRHDLIHAREFFLFNRLRSIFF
ncbi:MAG: hypothetical protein AABY16_01965 [Nanoarchaeota archaeon]